MKMIDLKRPKPKKEKNTKDMPMPCDESYHDERPYCLRFTLEKPELDKLGLTPQSFSGMKPVTATVLIDPITIRDVERKNSKGEVDNDSKSVEFQIMEIAVGNMSKKETSKFKEYDDAQDEGPGGKMEA